MKKTLRFFYILFVLILVTSLVACSNEGSEQTGQASSDNELYQGTDVSLELDKNKIPAENWKVDGSHQKLVTGKLLAEDKPVIGAEVQISNKRKTTTDEHGEFTILIDANIIEKDFVHATSLENATVDGMKLSDETKKSLLALEKELSVYYPIEIDKIEENNQNSDLVDVYAHAVVKEDEQYPRFSIEKFIVQGTIKDADGNPVAGATVNLRRDGVEGFTMSEPSNENGEYTMYYIPEDDENTYLNVYVPSEDITYTLPPGKAFFFPDESGITLNIILPKEGTIINDEPPTLEAFTGVKGALYKGVLIGVDASDYSITIPQRDGSFEVTMPKDGWESNPSFYEVNFNDFFDHNVHLGDTLTSDVIPQPTKHEPSNITGTKDN